MIILWEEPYSPYPHSYSSKSIPWVSPYTVRLFVEPRTNPQLGALKLYSVVRKSRP